MMEETKKLAHENFQARRSSPAGVTNAPSFAPGLLSIPECTTTEQVERAMESASTNILDDSRA